MAENANNTKQAQESGKKKYPFECINRPYIALDQWIYDYKDFEEKGSMEYFFGILCPVSTASAKVRTRTRAEYETIHKLVLSLFGLGVTRPEYIAEYTGLKLDMVNNILTYLENSSGHIKDGQLTEEGRLSLRENLDIQIFPEERLIQYEAITGTLLRPEMFQTRNDELAYLYDFDNSWVHKYEPKPFIERDIAGEIISAIGREDTYAYEKNIESVERVDNEYLTYVESFVIKYDFLPHPFIAFPYKNGRRTRYYPVSFSESNAEIMRANGLEFKRNSPILRPDGDFEYLIRITQSMRFDEMRANMEKEFFIGGTKYTVAEKNTENAEIKLYPGADSKQSYIPCYAVKAVEEGEVSNVDM